MTSRDRALSDRLIKAALVVLIASMVLRLNAIRGDSPGSDTAGRIMFAVSVVVFVVALGVRYIGKR